MPPIIIDRRAEAPIRVPVLPPEQKEALWGAIVRAYIKKHPEVFEEESKNA